MIVRRSRLITIRAQSALSSPHHCLSDPARRLHKQIIQPTPVPQRMPSHRRPSQEGTKCIVHQLHKQMRHINFCAKHAPVAHAERSIRLSVRLRRELSLSALRSFERRVPTSSMYNTRKYTACMLSYRTRQVQGYVLGLLGVENASVECTPVRCLRCMSMFARPLVFTARHMSVQ